MRHQGTISKWNDEKGYGFIVPASGGKNVFVHIKSLTNRQRRPVDNESVTYDVRTDTSGRLRAVNVAYVEYKAAPNHSPDETLSTIAGFFAQNGKVIGATLMILFFSIVVASGLRRNTSPPQVSYAPAPESVRSVYRPPIPVENLVDNSQIQSQGIVTRILPDDIESPRHQRFILRLPSGRTILIAHNIDIAPRIAGLQAGDTVGFSGIYESNEYGGVIHWTHHDPGGRHSPGWLQHNGQTYQ